MPTDEATLAELRQANARLAADTKRRRLAEIERRLKALEDLEEAKRVLASASRIKKCLTPR
jgi:hypothetical protein